MSRIRIMLVVNDLGVGGVQEVVLSQCAALDPTRFAVSVLSLTNDLDRLPSSRRPRGVTFDSAAVRPAEKYSVFAYLADAYALGRVRTRAAGALARIAASAPDILHFHTLPRDLGIGIVAARSRPCRLVFTDHAVRIRPDDYSPHARFLLRHAYRRLYHPYHVISVGRGVEAANQASGFFAAGRRRLLLENHVDLERFRPPDEGAMDAPRTAPVDFVYVARIQPGKQHETLVRAFAHMSLGAEARLTLVGPDGSAGAIEKLVRQVVPTDRTVRFLGVTDDVAEVLRRSSVGVFPSAREGRPLALLEMMACGLPVIVSDIPELTEIVTAERTGIVVPLGDAAALARAMTRLATDPELRLRLGSAARASVVDSVEANPIGRLEAFYEEVFRDG